MADLIETKYKFEEEAAFNQAKRYILNNALRRRQKSLDLSWFGLVTLPVEIGLLKDLRRLNISNNKLEVLPAEIFELRDLEHLDVSHNRLRSISGDLGSLRETRTLDLSHNLIRTLPPDISTCFALKMLNLDANRFRSVTDIGTPPNLERLHLRENQIQLIDEGIENLPYITDLYLTHNQIIDIHPNIGRLSNLRDLDLTNNQIELLPEELGNCKDLSFLHLEENQLEGLPRSFSRLGRLTYLDLDGNRLSSLPDCIIGIVKLRTLHLRNNRIRSLPDGLSGLRELDALYLSGNSLKSIPEDVGFMESLQILDILDNNLPAPYPQILLSGQPKSTADILAYLRGETVDLEDSVEGSSLLLQNPPKIPDQSYGPHFDIDEGGRIIFALPKSVDAEGNFRSRIEKLLPIIDDLSSLLIDYLGKGNTPFWNLRERIMAYNVMASKDINDIDFAAMYIEGVRLSNAYKVALEDREMPSLEAEVKECADSLLALHGTLMLSTAEGSAMLAAEQRYNRSADEERRFRDNAEQLLLKLRDAPHILDPNVTTFVKDAVAEIGKGENLERSAVIATGAIKNVAIATTSVAAIAAMTVIASAAQSPSLTMLTLMTSIMAGEGIKKSKPFVATSSLLTKLLDGVAASDAFLKIRDFATAFKPHLDFSLRANEELRKLAKSSSELEWLSSAIEWITEGSRKPPEDQRRL